MSRDRRSVPSFARAQHVCAALTCAGAALVAREARAVDLPPLQDSPVTLDVTETSIVSQRFRAREDEGEKGRDQGYFAWLNRLNALVGWKTLKLGVRLDSSLYALRPEDRDIRDPQILQATRIDGATRFRDKLYLAKIFLTYKTPDAELTVGDAYVQFGRGLVLSMRKVDELGIDTTLFGVKATAAKDIFGFTLIGGLANPARVDEPTGQALFVSRPVEGDRRGGQPTFGSDRIVGASITAGRGLAVVASTNAVVLSRCAPYRYNGDGTIIDGTFDRPIGTCEESDRAAFLGTLPTAGPVINSRETINASQTIEVPNLWGHGNLYFEGAVQKRDTKTPTEGNNEGNALYAAFVTTGGPITNTLELKRYSNFYPLAASVGSRALAFGSVTYSAPPTAEPPLTDVFGSANACVVGGRDRFDYRLTETLLVYGTLGYFKSKSEQPGGQCDRDGDSTARNKDETVNFITDVSTGAEWRFDNDKSIAFFNVGGRHDVKGDDHAYYREVSAQYSITKYISGPYAFELAGRHRYRIQENENVRGDTLEGSPWRQGEHQTALKIAPKWVLSQGIEYTTQLGFPTFYVNGGVLYRFTSQSSIRLYAGQNRGGLRCVSGICRVFPAFSGARAELTVRF